jgi:hypothetical protein
LRFFFLALRAALFFDLRFVVALSFGQIVGPLLGTLGTWGKEAHAANAIIAAK